MLWWSFTLDKIIFYLPKKKLPGHERDKAAIFLRVFRPQHTSQSLER